MSVRRSLARAEGREAEVEEREVNGLVAEEVLALEQAAEREGIEREMKVVRVGPNPRMVVCEYWELAERKVVVVKVGNNKKWLKGMVFKMREPVSEEEYNKPWEYRGRAPRRRGRW